MIDLGDHKYTAREIAIALIRSDKVNAVMSSVINILKNRLESVEDKLVQAELTNDELYFAELELRDANNTIAKNE